MSQVLLTCVPLDQRRHAASHPWPAPTTGPSQDGLKTPHQQQNLLEVPPDLRSLLLSPVPVIWVAMTCSQELFNHFSLPKGSAGKGLSDKGRSAFVCGQSQAGLRRALGQSGWKERCCFGMNEMWLWNSRRHLFPQITLMGGGV